MKNMNTMLHMKLNSAVSAFAVAAAFSVILPTSAYCGICFLPDCSDDILAGGGDINMNINEDTEWCEKKGYTYYASGKCPQYQAQVGKCSRDEYYLKCDAVTWCKQNGYNTQSCSLPSFVNGQCPNGKPYYKGCKEDRPRACRESGYVNSCSPGRLYATSNRCQWDSSYGKCCTASPSTGCPTKYAVDCDPSRGSSGTDTCGYTCYRCCSDECSRGSKNYSGSYATTTECGSTCRYCKDCTSGSRSYSGSYAGTSECGTCYYCSDTCRSGQKSVSCSSNYNKVRVSSTECGTGCYSCEYNSDCNVTSKSCSYGCASYNSCGKCTSCEDAPACSHSSHQTCTYGCASTCPCCSACKTCNSAPAAGGDSGSGSSGGGTSSCTDTCSSKGYYSSKPAGMNCSTKTVCGSTCYISCTSICTHGNHQTCSNGCKTTCSCCSQCTSCNAPKPSSYYFDCCDSSLCKDYSFCLSFTTGTSCSSAKSSCTSKGGTPVFTGCNTFYGSDGSEKEYSAGHKCNF